MSSSSNKNSLISSELWLNFTCQLIFRCLNLFFNSLIIRNLSLNLIGIGNIHFELFYSTILFLSRESLRRNIPKLNNLHSIYHYINLIWFILPFGFIFIFLSFFLTLFISTNNNQRIFSDYNQACFIYGLAAFIQLLSEPFYLLATITSNHRINIYIQFIASIIGFGLQTVLIIQNPHSALVYYGFGYLIYSMLTTLFYYFLFLISNQECRHRLFLIQSWNDLLIKPTSPFVDHKLLDETFKSIKKGISIRILTEGEKYLLTMFSLLSYEEQGIYYLIYLLGSTISRTIFSTIEQMTSKYFLEIFSSIRSRSNAIDNNQLIEDHPKSSTLNEERTLKLNALTLLNKLIRLSMIISLLLIIFIIPHSSSIINVYMGQHLSMKFGVILYLRLYLLEMFLIGINVLNESFVQAVMTIKQLNSYQNFILFYSFIYLIICFILTRLFGISGIILANCLNIFGRILLNNSFINRYLFRIKWLKSYLFSSHYIFLLIISLMIFYYNQILIENTFGQLIFAFGLILTIICLTLIEEKETIHYLYCVYKLNSQRY